MGFHGEVMFLLLGVKPAVLCTFPAAACGPEAPTPSQLAVHYATQVMLPALRSGGGSASTTTDGGAITSSDERTTWEVSVAGKRLLVGVVNANVSSAYCDEVGGSLIVYSPDDQRAALASRLLSPTVVPASEQEVHSFTITPVSKWCVMVECILVLSVRSFVGLSNASEGGRGARRSTKTTACDCGGGLLDRYQQCRKYALYSPLTAPAKVTTKR